MMSEIADYVERLAREIASDQKVPPWGEVGVWGREEENPALVILEEAEAPPTTTELEGEAYAALLLSKLNAFLPPALCAYWRNGLLMVKDIS